MKKAKTKTWRPEQTQMYNKGKCQDTCGGIEYSSRSEKENREMGGRGSLERLDTILENLKQFKEPIGAENAKKKKGQYKH